MFYISTLFISVKAIILKLCYYSVWSINSVFSGIDYSVRCFSFIMLGSHRCLFYRYTQCIHRGSNTLGIFHFISYFYFYFQSLSVIISYDYLVFTYLGPGKSPGSSYILIDEFKEQIWGYISGSVVYDVCNLGCLLYRVHFTHPMTHVYFPPGNGIYGMKFEKIMGH